MKQDKPDEKFVNFNLKIPRQLHRKMKAKCALNGVLMEEHVVGLIQANVSGF